MPNNAGIHLEKYKFVRVVETGGLGQVALYETDGDEDDVCVKFLKRSSLNKTREVSLRPGRFNGQPSSHNAAMALATDPYCWSICFSFP